MDIEYRYLPRRDEAIRRMNIYYLFLHTPWIVMCLLGAITLAGIGVFAFWDRTPPVLWIQVGVLLLVPFLQYLTFRRVILSSLDAAGIEAERALHLTDHEFTVTDGKSTLVVEYRNLKRYFRCGDLLFLLADSNLLYGIIQLDRLPDRGAELISCLRADKVKELKFWSFGHWWRMVALMAVILLFLWGIIYFATYPGITEC